MPPVLDDGLEYDLEGARPPGRDPDCALALAGRFARWSGRSPSAITVAPGRVNLIGEHTDYNEGFVLPVAIDLHTWVAAAPRDDQTIRVYSETLEAGAEFALAPRPSAASRLGGFADYVRGTAFVLRDAGWPIPGADLLVTGDLPLGAGLSSSAALELAIALALLGLLGPEREIDRIELARLCQRAENEWVGTRCGIMDQLVVGCARAGHALEIDCRSLAATPVPLPAGVRIVVCDSRVKHSLASGEYNRRRSECEEAVRRLAIHAPGLRSLRDVSPDQLDAAGDSLAPVVRARARHVVTENGRVRETVAALLSGRLADLGPLFAASHASLRDDYAVSCPELDSLVDIATGLPGVIGARMTGGGFGGSTVNLVHEDAVQGFVAEVAQRQARAVGREPAVYVCRASAAAQRWT